MKVYITVFCFCLNDRRGVVTAARLNATRLEQKGYANKYVHKLFFMHHVRVQHHNTISVGYHDTVRHARATPPLSPSATLG